MGWEVRVAEPPASRQKTFHKIDIAKAVWSGATLKDDTRRRGPGVPNTRGFRVMGWEALTAEPPASRQKTFHKIDIAKAVWSGAT